MGNYPQVNLQTVSDVSSSSCDHQKMNVTIRSAKKHEATQLTSIAIESKKYWNYPDHWFKLWGRMFEITPNFLERNSVWVALDEETTLGFVAISISGHSAELEHMWVLPNYINKGIGRKLLLHAIDFCRKHDISRLRIESDPNARGFYEKLGARQIGEVKSKPSPRTLPVLLIHI